jgi:hypothetical protein
MDAAWALQEAIYSRLTADQSLRALLGDPPRIFDQPPPEATFPMLILGAGELKPYAGIEGAFEHLFRFTAYSRWGGRRECKLIAAGVRLSLQDAALTLDGHRLIQSRLVFEDQLKLREPDIYQGVMRYRFVTVPEALVAA